MATSFTAAAIFDACALLVVLIAIRMRQAASPAVAAPSPAAEACSATAGSLP